MEQPQTGRRTSNRSIAPVPWNLEQRLLAYAAAASASLVATQPVAAKVIYTPINVKITTGAVPLDLNHDGVVDFNIADVHGFGNNCFTYADFAALRVNGAGNVDAGVMAYGASSRRWASALGSGAEIGPGQRFANVQNAAAVMVRVSTTCSDGLFHSWGNWAHPDPLRDRFLGLRFVVSGKTYYGWAGFSLVKSGTFVDKNGYGGTYIHARLTGVAYEDVPGQAISAGQLQDVAPVVEAAPDRQPATLGLLALGAQAIAIWRRREVGSEQ